MFSTVKEDETVLASFMDGSWGDEYELRLENELITEENWSDAVLRSENDITIHIVEKPRRSFPRQMHSSRASSRTDFSHSRRSYSARPTHYGESTFEVCAAYSSIY